MGRWGKPLTETWAEAAGLRVEHSTRVPRPATRRVHLEPVMHFDGRWS